LHTQSKFRLLVVRLGAMGDILHALPAVTALRQAHPGWIIDWVVEPKWRALLASESSTGRDTGCPAAKQPIVDHLYQAATKYWTAKPFSRQTRREFVDLRRALRESRYDAVIDFQGALRSAVIARMSGSGRVIGEDIPREPIARRLFTERVATQGAHVIEQDYELAATVAGDELKFGLPMLPVDPDAEAWTDQFLAGSENQPLILVNPGAGWGAKRWPVDRYAAVANEFVDRGCRVLVNAGPGEEELADVLVKETAGAVVALNSSLEHLIAVTRRVGLVIAGDTGPLHLACALGKPVVGIYGPTDPSRNGPFGTRFKVLRHPDSRRDHTRHEEPEAGLLTIQTDEVLRAGEHLLYSRAAQ
jgi:heptosyltransferase I